MKKIILAFFSVIFLSACASQTVGTCNGRKPACDDEGSPGWGAWCTDAGNHSGPQHEGVNLRKYSSGILKVNTKVYKSTGVEKWRADDGNTAESGGPGFMFRGSDGNWDAICSQQD